MLNFKKALNLKIVSIVVTVVFLIQSTVYGIDLPEKTHLRNPLIATDPEKIERLEKAYYRQIEQDLGPHISGINKIESIEDRRLVSRVLHDLVFSGLDVFITKWHSIKIEVIREDTPTSKKIEYNNGTIVINLDKIDISGEEFKQEFSALVLEHLLRDIDAVKWVLKNLDEWVREEVPGAQKNRQVLYELFKRRYPVEAFNLEQEGIRLILHDEIEKTITPEKLVKLIRILKIAEARDSLGEHKKERLTVRVTTKGYAGDASNGVSTNVSSDITGINVLIDVDEERIGDGGFETTLYERIHELRIAELEEIEVAEQEMDKEIEPGLIASKIKQFISSRYPKLHAFAGKIRALIPKPDLSINGIGAFIKRHPNVVFASLTALVLVPSTVSQALPTSNSAQPEADDGIHLSAPGEAGFEGKPVQFAAVDVAISGTVELEVVGKIPEKLEADITQTTKITADEIALHDAIQEDIDFSFELFDTLYQNREILTLEEAIVKILPQLSKCKGLIFGEDHNIKVQKDAVAYIIRKVSDRYPIGMFLEEIFEGRSGEEDEPIFSNFHADVLIESNVRMMDTFSLREQFNPDAKIKSALKKLGRGELGELLVTYTGNAHTTSVLSKFLGKNLKHKLTSSIIGTVEEAFQKEGEDAIVITMIDEELLFDDIQNVFLKEIFNEDSSPEVLLAKIKIFKQLWVEKVENYPHANQQYFVQHPVEKNVYFGVISGNRKPRLIQLFEMALQDPEIRKRCEKKELNFVRIDCDAKHGYHRVLFEDTEKKENVEKWFDKKEFDVGAVAKRTQEILYWYIAKVKAGEYKFVETNEGKFWAKLVEVYYAEMYTGGSYDEDLLINELWRTHLTIMMKMYKDKDRINREGNPKRYYEEYERRIESTSKWIHRKLSEEEKKAEILAIMEKLIENRPASTSEGLMERAKAFMKRFEAKGVLKVEESQIPALAMCIFPPNEEDGWAYVNWELFMLLPPSMVWQILVAEGDHIFFKEKEAFVKLNNELDRDYGDGNWGNILFENFDEKEGFVFGKRYIEKEEEVEKAKRFLALLLEIEYQGYRRLYEAIREDDNSLSNFHYSLPPFLQDFSQAYLDIFSYAINEDGTLNEKALKANYILKMAGPEYPTIALVALALEINRGTLVVKEDGELVVVDKEKFLDWLVDPKYKSVPPTEEELEPAPKQEDDSGGGMLKRHGEDRLGMVEPEVDPTKEAYVDEDGYWRDSEGNLIQFTAIGDAATPEGAGLEWVREIPEYVEPEFGSPIVIPSGEKREIQGIEILPVTLRGEDNKFIYPEGKSEILMNFGSINIWSQGESDFTVHRFRFTPENSLVEIEPNDRAGDRFEIIPQGRVSIHKRHAYIPLVIVEGDVIIWNGRQSLRVVNGMFFHDELSENFGSVPMEIVFIDTNGDFIRKVAISNENKFLYLLEEDYLLTDDVEKLVEHDRTIIPPESYLRFRLYDSDLIPEKHSILGDARPTDLNTINRFLNTLGRDIAKAYINSSLYPECCKSVSLVTAEKMRKFGIEAYVVEGVFVREEEMDHYYVVFKVRNSYGEVCEMIVDFSADQFVSFSVVPVVGARIKLDSRYPAILNNGKPVKVSEPYKGGALYEQFKEEVEKCTKEREKSKDSVPKDLKEDQDQEEIGVPEYDLGVKPLEEEGRISLLDRLNEVRFRSRGVDTQI